MQFLSAPASFEHWLLLGVPGLYAEVVINVCAIFACGIVTWTFLEYLIHGWLSHVLPTFVSQLHQVHHRDPRAVFAIGAWLPLAVLWLAAVVLFGFNSAVIYLTGILTGFAAYEALHYRIHFCQAQNSIERYLRTRHLLHHHRTPGNYLGVTSPFWDVLFGTELQLPADAAAFSARIGVLEGPTNLSLLFRFHYLQRNRY